MGATTVIASDNLRAAVDSEGAQLLSLALDGREYLWRGDGRWWPRRAPVLFPIVGAPVSYTHLTLPTIYSV